MEGNKWGENEILAQGQRILETDYLKDIYTLYHYIHFRDEGTEAQRFK